MTAQRPIRGNDWKRFLTWDEDEEIPADWNAAELPSTWGTAKARQLVRLPLFVSFCHRPLDNAD